MEAAIPPNNRSPAPDIRKAPPAFIAIPAAAFIPLALFRLPRVLVRPRKPPRRPRDANFSFAAADLAARSLSLDKKISLLDGFGVSTPSSPSPPIQPVRFL